MKKIYNKLVRDNIPEIIKSSGKKCNTRVLDKEEFINSLNKKLEEEFNEYKESCDILELADMLEVIYGILDAQGIAIEEFEKIRKDKKEARGGFKKGIFLIDVTE